MFFYKPGVTPGDLAGDPGRPLRRAGKEGERRALTRGPGVAEEVGARSRADAAGRETGLGSRLWAGRGERRGVGLSGMRGRAGLTWVEGFGLPFLFLLLFLFLSPQLKII